MSKKEDVGTKKGVFYHTTGDIEHKIQDLPSDGWKVDLSNQSQEIQEEYQADNGWAYDKTFQVKLQYFFLLTAWLRNSVRTEWGFIFLMVVSQMGSLYTNMKRATIAFILHRVHIGLLVK